MSAQPHEAHEDWRDVPGYEGRYRVSDLGRVESSLPYHDQPCPRILSTSTAGGGYPCVTLVDDVGRRVTKSMHALVTHTFIGLCPPGLVTRHLDGDPMNNALGNLTYGTVAENQQDAVRHGTHVSTRKTHCPAGHPYDDENTTVSGPRSYRKCRACNRARHALRYTEIGPRRRMARAEQIVQALHGQEITAEQALARLRRAHLNDDREALAECVAALYLRDTFLLREGDPYEFVGVAPRAGLRVWQMAVELAEQALESHIRLLAMQP